MANNKTDIDDQVPERVEEETCITFTSVDTNFNKMLHISSKKSRTLLFIYLYTTKGLK